MTALADSEVGIQAPSTPRQIEELHGRIILNELGVFRVCTAK